MTDRYKYIMRDPYVDALFYNGANKSRMKNFVGNSTSIQEIKGGALHITNTYQDVTVPVGHYLVKLKRFKWVTMDIQTFDRMYKKYE